MPGYLYRIQPTCPEMLSEGHTPKEAELTSQHFNYLKDLHGKGVVILAGRTLNTDPSSFGIIIFQAENEAAAQTIVDNDPGVKKGLFHAALFPYRVALLAGRD